MLITSRWVFTLPLLLNQRPRQHISFLIPKRSDKMFNKMHTGFRALVWDIAALGCYGGFRQQEYTVDHKNKVKYFIAFTMETILFRDIDRMIICDAFFRPDLVKAVGTRYAVQKNRHNGQVIWYSRGMANSRFCLVVRALSLVRRTAILGHRHRCICPSLYFLPFSASYRMCSSCRSWHAGIFY